MIIFIIGIFIGASIGVILMSCLIAGKHADEIFERDREEE